MAVELADWCNRPAVVVVVGNAGDLSQTLACTVDYAGLVVVVVIVVVVEAGCSSLVSCLSRYSQLLCYYYYFDSTYC